MEITLFSNPFCKENYFLQVIYKITDIFSGLFEVFFAFSNYVHVLRLEEKTTHISQLIKENIRGKVYSAFEIFFLTLLFSYLGYIKLRVENY